MSATLYRCRTPTDRLCACGRVARELRREGIDYEEVRVAWRRRDRDEVAEASGQRVVPLLVIEGEAICDSRRIVEHLRARADDAAAGTGEPVAGAGEPPAEAAARADEPSAEEPAAGADERPRAEQLDNRDEPVRTDADDSHSRPEAR
jgi:glutaredoxin